MVRELGYKNGEPIYLHFHTPGTKLDFGLMPLVTDGDVNNMSKYVKENKFLHIYMGNQHLMNLFHIFMMQMKVTHWKMLLN